MYSIISDSINCVFLCFLPVSKNAKHTKKTNILNAAMSSIKNISRVTVCIMFFNLAHDTRVSNLNCAKAQSSRNPANCWSRLSISVQQRTRTANGWSGHGEWPALNAKTKSPSRQTTKIPRNPGQETANCHAARQSQTKKFLWALRL